MALTAENIKQLNNMNEAARRADLGTLLGALTAESADTLNEEGYTPIAMATVDTAGIVKKATHQANSKAADIETLVSDFNALLTKLRTAGIMA